MITKETSDKFLEWFVLHKSNYIETHSLSTEGDKILELNDTIFRVIFNKNYDNVIGGDYIGVINRIELDNDGKIEYIIFNNFNIKVRIEQIYEIRIVNNSYNYFIINNGQYE